MSKDEIEDYQQQMQEYWNKRQVSVDLECIEPNSFEIVPPDK